MARVKINQVIVSALTGEAILGASVQVNERVSGSATTLYQASTGGTTVANPIVTSTGKIDAWVEEGSYDLVVSGIGFSTYTQGWEAHSAQLGPTRGTSLPGSPVDEQEYYYVADATNSVVWHFVYRSGSAAARKWDFLGGPALRSGPVGDHTITTTETTATNLASGPSITVPLTGEYDLTYGGVFSCLVEGSAVVVSIAPYVGATVKGTGAIGGSSDLNTTSTATQIATRVSLTASDVVNLKTVADVLVDYRVYNGWIELRPVRV